MIDVLVMALKMMSILMIIMGFLLLVYAAARIASIGYFRSKQEHFKEIWKLTNGENQDGER